LQGLRKREKSLKTLYLTRLVFLICITLAVQLIGLPQLITGPVVNLMLVLTTLTLNLAAGLLLGIITPLVAAVRGQLPAFMLPMLPFIIIGNALLVTVFAAVLKLLKRKQSNAASALSWPNWLGILAGSLAKFIWLYWSAQKLLKLFMGIHPPAQLITAMGLLQLITAIVGGVLALVISAMLQTRYFGSQKL
jgi:hypothetical protein